MRKRNELSVKDLKDICNPNLFKFETTKELVDTSDLIYGQERGMKALEFGTDIEIKGYNMYLEGPSGVGKTMYTRKFLEKKAEKAMLCQPPKDIIPAKLQIYYHKHRFIDENDTKYYIYICMK